MTHAATATELRFDAGTEVCKFITSNKIVDVIVGPLGSGKTKALLARIMRHAQEQAPSPIDAVRRTRFAAVRNTMPDLKRTTIRSWLELFPEHIYGRFNWGAAMHHHIRFGDVDTTVDFLSLDKDEDVRKLRSGEYTGIFFDELEFIVKLLVDEARSRLRYPPPEHGGPTWRGVCAATNAPPEDHWLPIMTGKVELPPGLSDDEVRALSWPPEWGYYEQPPALLEQFDQHGIVVGYTVNSAAENLKNLPVGYYEQQIIGQTKAWIDSRLMVRTVLVATGSPVHPQFRREAHVASEVLRPKKGYEVFVGLDFGRTPAALFVQVINGRTQFQYELLGLNESSAVFAPKVRQFFIEKYPDHSLSDARFFGDPKGQDKGQAEERTSYEIFAANGMTVRAPPGLKNNDIGTRISAVDHLLMRMMDGKPAFMSSPMCRTFNVGMAGRYCNERDEQGELRPAKNRYSHACDAGQYVILGLGEGRTMTGRPALGDMRGVQTHSRRQSMRRLSA